MAQQAIKTSAVGDPTTAFEIEEDQWVAFLAEFTRENRGVHARLEVLTPEDGHQVETENLPFDHVLPDVEGGEHHVWITFGPETEDHLTCGIQNVRDIWVRLPSSETGTVLELVANDGTKTVLQLSPLGRCLPDATGDAVLS